MADADFSVARLRDLVHYDPKTGVFTLRVGVSHIRKAGCRIDVARHGERSSGYKAVNLFGRRFLAHRMAWAIHFGEWPSHPVDHINGDRSDNRIANLRRATNATNAQNQRVHHTRSKTGVMGVHVDKGRYRAQITVNRSTVHIGTFNTAEEAHAAYLEAKRKYHPGCVI